MLSGIRKLTDATHGQQKSSTAASIPLEGNTLLEALICEFHWTALQIGAVTCCMSACVETQRTWMLRSCANLIPVESSVVRLALRSWQDVAFPKDLTANIGRIYFDLADAKKIALPLIHAAGSRVGPDFPTPKLLQVAVIWRKLAEDCGKVVQDLEPETRWRLAGLYTANTLILGKFLKGAANGEHACVDRQGDVRLPLLPQRRWMPRYPLMQACKVSSQSSRCAAVARDVSRTGIGLNCDREFKLKEPVSIELESNRTLRGVVVYSKKGKVGVQFDVLLAEGDPLLAG